MERLASLEASLEGVDRAIAKNKGKAGARRGEARRADANNSLMDRKGGGPMRWNEFYGTTAEKFFYHPVDPSTRYHTSTVLRQMGSEQDDKLGSGVPSSQSLPVHQRPPQFDYIYRANRDARDRAETELASLQGQLEELLQRREKLEKEQVDLWCRLAFRGIQRLNIPRRPELRFRLASASNAPDDLRRVEVVEQACRFLATGFLIIEKAEEDQDAALTAVKTAITDARNQFDDVLLKNASVAGSKGDRATALGQFTALSQLLDDTAQNLGESYEIALDGDRAGDLARKTQFRGLLQRSLIEYAQVLLAVDECSREIQTEWQVSANTSAPLPDLGVEWGKLQAPSQDPVVGKWQWFADNRDSGVVEFLADGTFDRKTCSWALVSPEDRRYEFRFASGFVDSLKMTDDGLSMVGQNNRGMPIEAKKLLEISELRGSQEIGADILGGWWNSHDLTLARFFIDKTAVVTAGDGRILGAAGRWKLDDSGHPFLEWPNNWKWSCRVFPQGVMAYADIRPDGAERGDGIVMWRKDFDWRGQNLKQETPTSKSRKAFAGSWQHPNRYASWVLEPQGVIIDVVKADGKRTTGRWTTMEDGSMAARFENGHAARAWVSGNAMAAILIKPDGGIVEDGSLLRRDQDAPP